MARILSFLILAGTLAPMLPGAATPGGRFDDRLRQAEQRYSAGKSAKPGKPAARTSAAPSRVRKPVRRSTRAAVSRPTYRTARTARTARREPVRPRSRVAGNRMETRPARPVRTIREERLEEEESPVAVSFSVDPRADRSSSSLTTGDLVLFAQPANRSVYFEWEGGARRSSRTTVVKGLLPGPMQVRAYHANGTQGTAWVTIKAGCITTVRFAFPR